MTDSEMHWILRKQRIMRWLRRVGRALRRRLDNPDYLAGLTLYLLPLVCISGVFYVTFTDASLPTRIGGAIMLGGVVWVFVATLMLEYCSRRLN